MSSVTRALSRRPAYDCVLDRSSSHDDESAVYETTVIMRVCLASAADFSLENHPLSVAVVSMLIIAILSTLQLLPTSSPWPTALVTQHRFLASLRSQLDYHKL